MNDGKCIKISQYISNYLAVNFDYIIFECQLKINISSYIIQMYVTNAAQSIEYYIWWVYMRPKL